MYPKSQIASPPSENQPPIADCWGPCQRPDGCPLRSKCEQVAFGCRVHAHHRARIARQTTAVTAQAVVGRFELSCLTQTRDRRIRTTFQISTAP
jgi:hypothetical protein